MHISWILLAENVAVNEQSQRIDILGEFRRVIADQFPYSLSKFFVICRAEIDAQDHVTLPYKLTLRMPSDGLVELHSSDVSVNIPPNVNNVVGNLIAEIRDFEFTNQGQYSITAQLGESVCSADFIVVPQRAIANDTQE